MLLGLLYPTKGKAAVLGGDGSNPKISSRIGFLPEESYLYRYLSARETLDFYGRLFGLPPKVRKLRIEALLDMVGLKAVANRAVGTFSKGMARRIGLAQALINDPELLILDEPTTGLDPIGTRQIKDLILELAKRGKTILLCSHLLADVEDVCDRISILYGGKIQAEGQVRELLLQSDKMQITTDTLSDNAVERIKKLIKDEHADCEVISPMEKLETFFIKTVADAQQQELTTSGAVSTTGISDFLVAKAAKENILDKLVSAPESGQIPPRSGKTERVVPVETAETKPDDKLLRELTKPAKPEQPKPVSRERKIKTQPVESEVPKPEQIRKNILDRLTDGSSPRNDDREQTDKSENKNED